MSFRFNFSNGSDISLDDGSLPDAPSASVQAPLHAANLPRLYTLDELAQTLPQNISYSTLVLHQPHLHGREIRLPRRELYDVRMQLMAEDEDLGDYVEQGTAGSGSEKRESDALADFVGGNEDVRSGTYEGGLKSWECSVDMVNYLAEEEEGDVIGRMFLNSARVFELGCGTALPTLFLFQKALHATDSLPPHLNSITPRFTFHLADYNYSVLRLVTLANILLSWVQHTNPSLLPSSSSKGDLGALPELISTFLNDLSIRGIGLAFVSGCWGQEMLSTLSISQEKKYDLVMGSETIYEPMTVPEFTKVLLGSVGGVGLVGAKRIYFGVGGSVGDFVKGVEGWSKETGVKWEVKSVREAGMEKGGVGRVILEVRTKSMMA